MQRREVPEIPREAVREVIANALCHRDYTTGTSVQVNVYMDFIEIVSPGLFPEGDSPDRHLEGSGGDSKQRNPNIAQVLFRSGMIEQYGTGIPRIKRARDAAGVAFSYHQDVNSTVIRFERPGAQTSDAAAVSSTGAASLEILSETEKVAMQIAHDSGRVAKKELMEQTGVGKVKATETLKRLAERGLLEWVGSNQHDPRQYYRASGGRQVPARYCPRHSTSPPNAAGMSRYPFCQDENAGKNERSALLEASRFRKPTRARKASLNVTN